MHIVSSGKSTSEAKVECEAWPKQKSLKDKNGKYGNLVKLPVCYHQQEQEPIGFS